MKIVGLLVTLLIAFVPTAGSAQWLAGGKIGTMFVKFDDVETNKNPINVGVTFGYEFNNVLPGLALELDISRSIAPGTVMNSDLRVESQGVYVSYRTGHQLYFKARLGLMQAALTGEFGEDEGGETYGIAVGWKFAKYAIELDYTSIDDDVAFASLGVLYRY